MAPINQGCHRPCVYPSETRPYRFLNLIILAAVIYCAVCTFHCPRPKIQQSQHVMSTTSSPSMSPVCVSVHGSSPKERHKALAPLHILLVLGARTLRFGRSFLRMWWRQQVETLGCRRSRSRRPGSCLLDLFLLAPHVRGCSEEGSAIFSYSDLLQCFNLAEGSHSIGCKILFFNRRELDYAAGFGDVELFSEKSLQQSCIALVDCGSDLTGQCRNGQDVCWFVGPAEQEACRMMYSDKDARLGSLIALRQLQGEVCHEGQFFF